MKNFEKIKKVCTETSKISEKVIDDFLLNYAAKRNNLEQEIDQKFELYRHICKKLPKETVNIQKSQYIIHKVLKKEGLIKNYLNNINLKMLAIPERNYLEFQAEHPWKFCFSRIKTRPAENFFVMEDVFSQEEFLLYSPGAAYYLESQSPILWFNLISFNGDCWQSFGPIGAFNSFEPDDIYFFATEMNPDISNEQELLMDMDKNPVPYMMLLSGGNYPLTYNKKDQMINVIAEYDLEMIDTKSLTKSFKTEYNKGVYCLSLKTWCEMPHYSLAYYDENKKTILLSAMTDRGFKALAEGLNEFGYSFSADPFLRVNISMLITASDILKKKIRINKYDNLFSKDTSPVVQEGIDKLNVFMKLVLPEINSGREPDIEALALKAGVDIQNARELIQHIKVKFAEMGKNDSKAYDKVNSDDNDKEKGKVKMKVKSKKKS